MSGGSLSQEEIDALLKAGEAAGRPTASPVTTPSEPAAAAPSPGAATRSPTWTTSERDTIGEVGNICMSSAATTLSLLLSRPVQITTPLGRARGRGGGARASSTRPP